MALSEEEIVMKKKTVCAAVIAAAMAAALSGCASDSKETAAEKNRGSFSGRRRGNPRQRSLRKMAPRQLLRQNPKLQVSLQKSW